MHASKFFLIAGLFCMTESDLFAASMTWSGTTDTNWRVSTNWIGGVVPGSGDIAYIKTSGAVVNAGSGPSGGDDYIAAGGQLYLQASGVAPVFNMQTGRQLFCNNGNIVVGSGGSNYGGVFNVIYGILNGYYNGNNNILNLNIAASGAGYTNATGTMNFGLATAPTGITMPSYLGGTGGTGAVVQVGRYSGETGVLNLSGYGVFTTYNGYGGATGNVAYATTAYNSTNGIGAITIGGNGGNGTLSIAGGHLTIGTGTLTLGANGGTAYLNETIDSSGISTITATAGVSLGTGSYFNLTLGSGFSATLGQTYTLISTNGAITGAFSNLADGGTYTDNGYAFIASYGTGTSNTFTLRVTMVAPEPQTWMMMATGLGMLMGGRRMCRRIKM